VNPFARYKFVKNVCHFVLLRGARNHHAAGIIFLPLVPAGKVPGFAYKKGNDRYIAVDANLPQPEQLHTALHEIAHHELSHFEPQHRRAAPWYLERHYKSKFMAEVVYRTKRWLRLRFGKEWEADLWALLVFPKVGTMEDIEALLAKHPEKVKWFWIALAGHVLVRIRKFIGQIFQLDIKSAFHRLHSSILDLIAAFALVSSLSGPVPVPKTYGAIGERSTARIVRPNS
jgi:hypothetical protein